MSLAKAKRDLQWRVVEEALADAGVDEETIKLVKSARNTDETVHLMASSLLGGADAKVAKNYIKVEMVGMTLPFDRMYIELVRPEGKTSHELRELLRDRLTSVKHALLGGIPTEEYMVEIIKGIVDDLRAEQP